MAVTKVNKSYYDITGIRLKNTSHLKLYPIYKDDKRKFLNIFRSFNLRELDVRLFTTHQLDYEDRWDNLAYKYYDTTRLWWTIPMVNKIENPFEQPEAGTNIKVLKKDYVYSILNEMKKLGDI